MQPIILDTTFILPLFGFKIDLTPKAIEQILFFLKKGSPNFEIIIPSIALIEIVYKFNSIFRHTNDNTLFDYISATLPVINNLPHLKIFNCESSVLTTEIALKIRTLGHRDIMDCYIAATAFSFNGIYLTEENTIQNTLKLIPDFSLEKIWNWKQLQKFL